MAKRRKKTGRNAAKTATVPVETEQLAAQGDLEVLRGRFANHIQVSIQEEEFVLDFFARGGDQTCHLSRVFLTPTHAKRLADALKRQTLLHKKRFKSSPLRIGS